MPLPVHPAYCAARTLARYYSPSLIVRIRATAQHLTSRNCIMPSSAPPPVATPTEIHIPTEANVVQDEPAQSAVHANAASTDKAPAVLEVRRMWPVPHVMVYCAGVKIAWGRSKLMQLGYEATMKLLCEKFFGPSGSYVPPTERAHLLSDYNRKAILLGRFYYTTGDGDESPVLLDTVGWSDVITNVTSIILDYTPPSSESASSAGNP